MVIYIASSWRNQHAVEMLSSLLRERGHKVISFVEAAVEVEGRSGLAFDVDEWIASEDGRRKFDYDTKGATRSELVIYIGPSGTDAWAEVGAAWASGVPVIGLYAKGEQAGLMQRMVVWRSDYREILTLVDEMEGIRAAHQAYCSTPSKGPDANQTSPGGDRRGREELRPGV